MPPSFVRQLRNNTAQSDGTTIKLGAHILAAVAARVPSLKLHIPCIRTLRMSVGCLKTEVAGSDEQTADKA